MHKKSIALVSMPFGPLNMPSIGLSIIKSVCAEKDINARVHYCGFKLAEQIGLDLYNAISSGYPAVTSLAGEFLFSELVHDSSSSKRQSFIREILKDPKPYGSKQKEPSEFYPVWLEGYQRAFEGVSSYIDLLVNELLSDGTQIFGFTSMFQQNMASLALAKKLKEANDGCFVIFGGPNVEGKMGQALLKSYDFIDAICSGEGEEAIISLMDYLTGNLAYPLHPNVVLRNYARDLQARGAMQIDLNRLPTPDHSDYFDALSRFPEKDRINSRIPFETSRGCWWGAKHHCTFCGLNGSNMSFRSKSASKALAELGELLDRYPRLPVSVVDNILDYRYFDSFLPQLAASQIEAELFYETKANLSKEKLLMLKQAGINRLQPGIESFSTEVLKIMKKGISAMQNVQLLKWCKELRIVPEWNLIWGFPEEPITEYEKMSELLPKIFHLEPPNGAAQLRLDRFSPLYEASDAYGVEDILPQRAYQYVYDLPPDTLKDIAYYFEFRYCDKREPKSYTARLETIVQDWKELHTGSELIYFKKGRWTVTIDTRSMSHKEFSLWEEPTFDIMSYCELPRTWHNLERKFLSSGEAHKSFASTISLLLSMGILIELDDQIFNIACNLERYELSGEKLVSVLTRMLEADKGDDPSLVVIDTLPGSLTNNTSDI